MRKNPSAPAPNALPGRITTPTSSIARCWNAAEVIPPPSGSGTHRYIVARGDSTSNPLARNAGRTASRRARNCATYPRAMVSASASTAAPADCTAKNAPVSMKFFTFASAAISSGRPTTQPSRQPVMQKLLESE